MNADALDRLVRVEIDEGRLAARLIIEPGCEAALLSEMALAAALDTRGVVRPPDLAPRLAALLESRRAAPDQRHEAVVVEGTRPRHGVDGRIELTKPEAAPPAPASEDDSGRVDHRARSVFVAVRAGEVVARVIEPQAGEDGVDVLGRALAAREGRPCEVTLDESVERRADGAIVARVDGILERGERLLRVLTRLVVERDVDYTTGHVEFPGDVLVEGGVRDCFRVQAAGDLEIRGSVEAATLTSGRDTRLALGMAAREIGSLRCGRDLSAGHLSNARAEVVRDATFANEVTNCTLVVGRRFSSPHASVVGGSLLAAGECEVGQVGSEAGVATEVGTGMAPELDTLERRLAEAQPALERRLEASRRALDQLQRAVNKLTHAQAEELTELQFRVADDEKRLASVQSAARRIGEVRARHASGALIVRVAAHRGARLRLGGWVIEVQRTLHGPFRLAPGERGEPTLTPLSSGASSTLAGAARLTPPSTPLSTPPSTPMSGSEQPRGRAA